MFQHHKCQSFWPFLLQDCKGLMKTDPQVLLYWCLGVLSSDMKIRPRLACKLHFKCREPRWINPDSHPSQEHPRFVIKRMTHVLCPLEVKTRSLHSQRTRHLPRCLYSLRMLTPPFWTTMVPPIHIAVNPVFPGCLETSHELSSYL